MPLNELVVEFKKTKNSQILNQIFTSLSKVIHEKSKYIFYQQKFSAKKYVFRLVDTKQVDIMDVEQELNLFTLELINRCDINKPFDKYFYSSIWLWKPKFINQDFVNSLRNVSDIKLSDEGDEYSLIDGVATFPKFDEPINLDDLFDNLSDNERKILNILKDNPKTTQEKIAQVLGVTRERVSQIYVDIRKKYKD